MALASIACKYVIEGVYLDQTALHCYLMHKYMQLINVRRAHEGLIMGCGELRGLLHIIS
jgi:hypothetical protein